MSFNILSLDGGGIRGLLTCRLLQRIQETHPGFLENVDLIAGTSTGGILALGIAAGVPLDEIADIYEKKGSSIFSQDFWDRFGDLDRLEVSDYDNRSLKAELTDIFKNLRLGDLKKKVLISSFKLDSGPVLMPSVRAWKPKFFHNLDVKPPKVNRDCDELAVDVALRTSAAPTFFPLYQGYADGGVVANNPSMCALAQALDPETGGPRALADILLLSVGTGATSKWLPEVDNRWGIIPWGRNLISIMMDGVSGVADYQCRQLLGSNYIRLNVNFQREISLDNLKEVPNLNMAARAASTAVVDAWFRGPAQRWLVENN